MNIQSTAKMIVDSVEPDLKGSDRVEAEQLVEQLFITRIGVAVLEALSTSDREQYQQLFIEGDRMNSPEAQQFVQSRIPHMENLISQEAQGMIKDFL